MYFKDGGYYYVRKNKWTHLGNDLMSATARYRTVEHGLDLDIPVMPAWFSMEKYVQQVYWRAQKGAKKRSIPFELSKDEYRQIVARANGHCEVTGVVFELTISGSADRRPFAPSLDRIDSSGHYTAGNCRLVCGIVNAALGAWGEDIFWRMVRMAKRKHRDRRKNLETSNH
jgi:hypothetical protein